MYLINKIIYKVNGKAEPDLALSALEELKSILENKSSFQHLPDLWTLSFDPLCEETTKEFLIKFSDYDEISKGFEYYFKVKSSPPDEHEYGNKIRIEEERLKFNDSIIFTRKYEIANFAFERKLKFYMERVLLASFKDLSFYFKNFLDALNSINTSKVETEFTNPFEITYEVNDGELYEFNLDNEIQNRERLEANVHQFGRITKITNDYSFHYDDRLEKKDKPNAVKSDISSKIIVTLIVICFCYVLFVGIMANFKWVSDLIKAYFM